MPSHWEDYRQAFLASLAGVKPAQQIVAEREGAVVGTVLLYPAGTVFSTPGGHPVTRAWPEVRLLASARQRGVKALALGSCMIACDVRVDSGLRF
jgi:hypothetical protein